MSDPTKALDEANKLIRERKQKVPFQTDERSAVALEIIAEEITLIRAHLQVIAAAKVGKG